MAVKIDEYEINKVLEYVNEFIYYKEEGKRQYNQSPDVRIVLSDKDGTEITAIEDIYFYDDVEIYNGKSIYKAPKDI